MTSVHAALRQVLTQCQKWCPDPEAVFVSVQPAAAPRSNDQQPHTQQQQQQQQQQSIAGPGGVPEWGWDDLKYSVGDTLNTGGLLLSLTGVFIHVVQASPMGSRQR